MPRAFAYCRVSTATQTAENQLHEITAAGFDIAPARAVQETVSGSVPAMLRPGFAKLVDRLEAGDILIVTKLDRLGRNATDVRQTVDRLAEVNVRVHCLALGGVDLCCPAGRMTMSVIAAVAEFERDLLVERTQAGLDRAKAEGKPLGRPASLSAREVNEVNARLSSGESVAAIARAMNTSRQTVLRVRERSSAYRIAV
jgi:putative DNA-invertase from lambdoid prophage Rac